jgi:hypothetical protein
MKTSLLLLALRATFIFFLFINFSEINSQDFWEWEDKIPLTDSLSDNTNPNLVYWYSEKLDEMMNVVWEKTVDENTTAIYYRDLVSAEEPVEVVSIPGVHFTHPVIMKMDHTDTLFYVFYQGDQDGSQDIYYSIFTDDGQFSQPVQFPYNFNESDEEYFTIGNDSYWDRLKDSKYVQNVIAWVSDGALLTCNFEKNGDTYSFSQPDTVDLGICSDPVIVNDQTIFYIKDNVPGRYIYTVHKQYPAYEWSEPSLYFDQGNCYNLAEDNVEPRLITWSSDSNFVFRNYLADSYWPYDGNGLGPVSDTPLDPAVCTLIIGVEPQQMEFYFYYMAFPSQDNGFDEIFMNEGYNWEPDPVFYNFSQAGAQSRNPEFYSGEPDMWNPWCFFVYLVWEEYRNNHWQIFSSRTEMCAGGIGENDANESFINIYPNPFKDDVTLSYTLFYDEFIKIEVIDLYGRKITELCNEKQLAGEQSFIWNGKDVPSGLYFIRLSFPEISSTIRLIKIN